ncbi:MAG: type II secretion system minor pseudopilin GspK [Oceanospirillaceae bacterium]|nr:type II secretion system minor pseudopilin GspK [Oceanospirillaceae bacterium]
MKPGPTTNRQRQRGVALIMVLLVVALISLVTVQLGSQLQLSIRQAANREQYQQAYWYGLGGERLARQLIESALQHDRRIHPGQAWARPGRRYPIDGGSIRIDIRDQGSCFNLNALGRITTTDSPGKQPRALRQLRSLMAALGGEADEIAALSEPLQDWLDADTLTSGRYGAEDLYYTRQQPPYLPANGPLVSLSELSLVRGFRRDADRSPLADRLRPYLCALPDSELRLNLNSLDATRLPLLSSVFEGQVPRASLQRLLRERPADGFRSADDFWLRLTADETLVGKIDAQVRPQLRVSSDHFLVRVEVDHYQANLVLYSRIDVNNGSTSVYQRHYGDLNE